METDQLEISGQVPENTTKVPEERETIEILELETEEISEERETEKGLKERATEKSEKLVKLPVSRIKHIMKMDPEALHSTQEAVFLITKATELFVGSLASEAYKQAAQAKRKTIQKKDIDAAIDCIDSLAFLEGVLD